MSGPEHPRSGNGWKLTAADVRQIRALLAGGESAKNLARCYGVSDTNVRYIVNGRIWRSV